MPAPSAASTRAPVSRSPWTARSTGTPTATGRWKCEPTDARTDLGLYRSTEASVRITASAPAASAQRSTVPAVAGVAHVGEDGHQAGLRGEDLLERRVQEAADTDQALRGDGLGDVGEHVRVGEVDPGTGRVGGVDDLRVAVRGFHRGEQLDQRGFAVGAPVCGGLAHGLRSLGDEPALLDAEVPLGQPPGGGDAGRTRGDQFGDAHGRRRASLRAAGLGRVRRIRVTRRERTCDAPDPQAAGACGCGSRTFEDAWVRRPWGRSRRPEGPSSRPR